MLTEVTVFVMELRVFRLYNNLLNFLFFFSNYSLQLTPVDRMYVLQQVN